MVGTNNAAGRLHTILDVMRSYTSGEKAKSVWPRVLADLELVETSGGSKPDVSDSDLLKRLAPVIQLPDDVRKQLNQHLSGEVDSFTQHLYLADDALMRSLNFEQKWSTVIAPIREELFNELFHSDRELAKIGAEPAADLEEVGDIHTRVLQLLEEVESAPSLPLELRRYLHKYLMLLDNALRQFKVTGMEGVREAAYAATGAWAVEQPDHSKGTVTDPIVTKFGSILNKIYLISGIATNIASLLTGAGGVFPLGMFTEEVRELESGEVRDEQTEGE